MTAVHLLGVAIGAGLGAVCRAAVDRTVFARLGPLPLPWATLAVNLLGSLLLGFVLEATVQAVAGGSTAAETLRLVVGTGFCGGLTTFSTFSWEVAALAREGRGRAGLAYAGLTMALGMVAVGLGALAGHMIG